MRKCFLRKAWGRQVKIRVVPSGTVLHLVLLRVYSLFCRLHFSKTEESRLLIRHPVRCAADQFTSMLSSASSQSQSIVMGAYG